VPAYQAHLETRNSGRLYCEKHDFRQPYRPASFYAILNFASFQGFSNDTMRAVAEVHYNAIRPGCTAIFDTMNVQGEQRDILESALMEAGFHIPMASFQQRLRRALQATGIPHVFIMGRPMIPPKGAYADDPDKLARDTATLHSLLAEFQAGAQSAYEAEQAALTPETRTARIMYNTG
jgi:hypothetical protein